MKRLFLTFISILFVFSFLFAQEQEPSINGAEDNWEFVGINNEKIYFMHKKKVDIENQNKRAYVREVALEDKDKPSNNKELLKLNITKYLKSAYTLLVFEFDCKNERQRIKSYFDFDSNGKEVDSYINKKTDWTDILPDTIAETFLETACKPK